ncbi:NAD(P)H-dependent oxidoreductase [Oceanirhabdus seepicola]|uniref:NAD(P)H-dependent oxidoreductase n=1 Tax=Oceanirhabdus seepicola TaxID=2828781 RepID=A0A9J6NYB1_9CLOT|nr:NAD(P)H-dependent oxidoreductase [Oceanirhabdus seepicola]MCM1988974.1 NAD(P)H-dependent oxidoreductase [Oceanirhabdus seepicola]
MKILLLNGSPKGEKSNTFKITTAFLEGLNENKNNNVDVINISKMEINHCIGCYSCWTKNPGECILKDDMAELINKYLESDLIIWSFPLYYFGMPSKIKAFLDRLLPTNLPYMSEREDGGSRHVPRYDLSGKKFVLISTCGFYSTENNYDALIRQFEIMYGKDLTKILCTEGELFRVPQLKGRTCEYLSYAKKAGMEYSETFKISDETHDKLSELLYPPEVFVKMADASWEINEPKKSSNKSYNFMKQMAALCNPDAIKGKDLILEMCFTDLDKTYQLCIENNKCTMLDSNLKPFTTRIEVPFELWVKISEGKENGAEAMMKKKYKVLGDFNVMLQLDEIFGGKNYEPEQSDTNITDKMIKTNMSLFLLPWIVQWLTFPINLKIGGAISIIVCSFVFFLSNKIKTTKYERISTVIISTLGVSALLGYGSAVTLPCLSYLIFGGMWLISSTHKIPLTAHYSCNSYNGEEAFDNPLFIKTNRILTFVWGLLYLIVSIFSYFLMKSNMASFTGLINSIIPAIMGVFTAWFSRWYPAKVAKG